VRSKPTRWIIPEGAFGRSAEVFSDKDRALPWWRGRELKPPVPTNRPKGRHSSA
jgi:hypothetical protein